MARSVRVGLIALVGLILVAADLRGQDTVLSELYGRGVHSYFENDFTRARAQLTEAIELGSRDPRAYYYRGLINAQMGLADEAESDFRTGAQLEITNDERIFPVGQSLQRIQGPLRLTLENYRRDARLAAKIQERKEQRARYEQLREAEGDVLRGPLPPAPLPSTPGDDPTDPFSPPGAAAPRPTENQPAPPVERPAAPAETPAEPNIFDDPADTTATPTPDAPLEPNPFNEPSPDAGPATMPAQPNTPATPATDDIFGDPGQPGADIFAPTPDTSAAPQPGTTPAAPATDDIFGDPGQPGADVFSPSPDTGAAPQPGTTPATPATDDIFGGPGQPGADIFSPSPDTGAAPQPGTTPATPATDDIFGNPPGTSTPAEAAPNAEGAGAEPSPFGEAAVDPVDVFGEEPLSVTTAESDRGGPSGTLGAILRAFAGAIPAAEAVAPATPPNQPGLAPATGSTGPAAGQQPAAAPSEDDPFGFSDASAPAAADATATDSTAEPADTPVTEENIFGTP